jgi:hypothetical protein
MAVSKQLYTVDFTKTDGTTHIIKTVSLTDEQFLIVKNFINAINAGATAVSAATIVAVGLAGGNLDYNGLKLLVHDQFAFGKYKSSLPNLD